MKSKHIIEKNAVLNVKNNNKKNKDATLKK